MKTTKCTIDRKIKLGLGVVTAIFTAFAFIGLAEGGYDTATALLFLLMVGNSYYLIKK